MSKHSMRKRVQVLDLEVERVDQGARARLLRAFFGQQLGQPDLRAVLAHVEPGAPRFARLVLGRDLLPACADSASSRVRSTGWLSTSSGGTPPSR